MTSNDTIPSLTGVGFGGIRCTADATIRSKFRCYPVSEISNSEASFFSYSAERLEPKRNTFPSIEEGASTGDNLKSNA